MVTRPILFFDRLSHLAQDLHAWIVELKYISCLFHLRRCTSISLSSNSISKSFYAHAKHCYRYSASSRLAARVMCAHDHVFCVTLSPASDAAVVAILSASTKKEGPWHVKATNKHTYWATRLHRFCACLRAKDAASIFKLIIYYRLRQLWRGSGGLSPSHVFLPVQSPHAQTWVHHLSLSPWSLVILVRLNGTRLEATAHPFISMNDL